MPSKETTSLHCITTEIVMPLGALRKVDKVSSWDVASCQLQVF